MYVFDRWSPYSYQNNREKYADDDEKREFTMRECLWFCMTSLTPQVMLKQHVFFFKITIIANNFMEYSLFDRVEVKHQKVRNRFVKFETFIQTINLLLLLFKFSDLSGRLVAATWWLFG